MFLGNQLGNQLGNKEPYYRLHPVETKAVVYSQVYSEKWSEKWSELTERQITILQIIQKNPKISRKELADEIKINQSAIQKHLKKLKQEGLLKRVGPDKGGYWKVSE